MLKIRSNFSKKYQIKKIKKTILFIGKVTWLFPLSNKKLIHAYGPMKKTVVMGQTNNKEIEDSAIKSNRN